MTIDTNVRPVALGSSFYFGVTDAAQGAELWSTDGSSPVKVYSFGEGTSLDLIGTAGRSVYLRVTKGGRNSLWRTDVSLGAVLVKGKDEPSRFGSIAGQGEAGGNFVFVASNTAVGKEVWVTDGSDAGTFPLEAAAGSASANPESVTFVNGRILFIASDANGVRKLWSSAGDRSALVEISGFTPERPNGSNCGIPCSFPVSGTNAYFVKKGTIGGGIFAKLWRTDGTVSGTSQLATVELADSTESIRIGHAAIGPNHDIFVPVNFKDLGLELGRLVPKTGGGYELVRILDLVPGKEGAQYGGGFYAFGKAYFRAVAATVGGGQFDLYVSDGTAAGTKPILAGTEYNYAGVSELRLVGSSGIAMFTAKDPSKGNADQRVYPYALTPGVSLSMTGLNSVKVLPLGTPSLAPNTILTIP